MSAFVNPAFDAFVAALGDELLFCQIMIRRDGPGFVLRHVDDAAADSASLDTVALTALRDLPQTTAAGAFRPLKSAPNLRSGWQLALRDSDSLCLALNILYPGAVADWFSARSPTPPVTNYRDFTARQTGMYRITASLAGAPAQAAVAACCAREFCLKRRFWTVEGLAPDAPPSKSAIPCLEPCAVMLEFARKVARWEQGVETDSSEISSDPPAECDFDSPANPRRRRFILEKQRRTATSPV